MTAISTTLQIETITIDDTGVFNPAIIGFIAREVGNDANPDSIVKFVVEIDEETEYLDGVSIREGRIVKVDGIFKGIAMEHNLFEILSMGLVLTAVRIG